MSKVLGAACFFALILLTAAVGYSQKKSDSSIAKRGDTIILKTPDTIFMKTPDTVFLKAPDTVLRIKNFTPYFTLHVDSTLQYKFEINRDPVDYYWYLKNPPVGLKIDKDNGLLHFKADKAFFLSGRLKYDKEYKVILGVQNLNDPKDNLDTTFTLVFYNTEIIPSRLKPSVASDLFMEEGDTLSFKVQCETGSFPIESITYFTNFPVRSSTPVAQCDDNFTWVIPFDFIRDGENVKSKKLVITFVGVDKFSNRDTAVINVNVKDAINYPFRVEEYNKTVKLIEDYIVQLKGTFMILDQNVKHTRKTRTTFDLSSATTALGGTVFSSLPDDGSKTAGKILPSVGVALVPVKEAVAPNKVSDQNSASLVRGDIQRLQYTITNNSLVGDKDEEIVKKTEKMKDDLKQVQLQLIDIPIVNVDASKTAVDKYFDSPKVKKKYRYSNKK